MKYLTMEEVISNGIEFAGDVCYSGEFGQQVYTAEEEVGGQPVNGILYEKYANGNISYYAYYEDGIPNGENVWFYESGKIKSHCIMSKGTIDGEKLEFFEDGNIKIREVCKYGLVLEMQEMDETGCVIKEKKELTDIEKRIFKKYETYYKSEKEN